ncbi:YceI family protein [Paenibacillus sp. N1-5-1-14]|uniref:YceI family protein n=1 Tax=Paenibacillus radicibacter TaxID=2972488 RepID=UPI0021590D34|nr:YceI family protein [Paenibacillus radicibacter]MCR8642895.1 YceI family protein [Paenibacillus radicibacter]
MKKGLILTVTAVVIVGLGIGGYTAFNRYLGNNIEIQSVTGKESTAGTAVAADKLNGKWDIASGSKVYWTVTTSKEPINFQNESVKGQWQVDLNQAAVMKGNGIVDMNGLNSGNDQRDSHVKEREDLLETNHHPEATFEAKSFSAIPKEWNEGVAIPFIVEGVLKVKGKEKNVKFESTAMYKNGQLLLSGKTKVLFSDFGMKNPQTIVLETQNELDVRLELVLNKV